MPARCVVVHDDLKFTDALVAKLGKDVAWFTDPVKALTALGSARTVTYLITRLQFADAQPVGLSLARLARAARPDVRVVFTGLPQFRDCARGLGEFIAEPVNAIHVGMVIEWLSSPHEEPFNLTGPDGITRTVVHSNQVLEGRRTKP
jgi:ActR/RegA family two-component response regulator